MPISSLGIDTSRYSHPEATGVEWYSYHLLNELIPLLGRYHNTEIRLYQNMIMSFDTELPPNARQVVLPAGRFWTLFRLSRELLKNSVERLFVPSHTLPLIFPRKSIITIHDVAFRSFRECYSWSQYQILHRSTKKAVKRAWRIIVPSEATKHDLIQHYRCPEDKIRVIPHGAPYFPRLIQWNEKEIKRFLERFDLKETDLYIAYVGRLETKKNLVRLLQGFKRFSQDFSGWKLVLAGKPGVGYELIQQTIHELELQNQVRLPGYITEEEKLFLLHGCRIVAFPSLIEGFGLPVLEGFSVRRPVLTSSTSALAEVAGKAAYLINPEKVEEISVGLKRLASDGLLVNKLVNEGTEQLKKFTWEKSARATLEVLMEE